MKKMVSQLIVAAFWIGIGITFGGAWGARLSQPFMIAFGCAFGAIMAAIIGGGVLGHLEHRRLDKVKKRVRIETGKDGRTVIAVEPK